MRVKKQKRHRKVVRFYSACFGFREPYKVLCDGTFIHHLLLHRLIPINDALARLLGTRIIPFTTRCIIGELRSLGESHREALEAAQQLMIARCDHEKRINAMDCIESVVGEANSEHFFVATQDADMRKKFQKDNCKRLFLRFELVGSNFTVASSLPFLKTCFSMIKLYFHMKVHPLYMSLYKVLIYNFQTSMTRE
ncbi:rRNA-processing protein UTP23 homolog isoform X5 [Zingiber officinale]|uniref:rRNA-processing protein UTP23 homolog isoform X5 n=1 Tax=Zingiber officinale TaxID=94328 RepID=UPI001C4D0C58|nr:rRNA-processing protein UTP23 homolog isoform X5 [Zingiber officinale]